MSYQPYKGIVPVDIPAGCEVLVSVYMTVNDRLESNMYGEEYVSSVEVAFRAKPHHTWGPPIRMERG